MRVTAETKQATRKSILEVAQKLFAQQGFEPTTTRDIARGARIGVGTLFNYFPTKESIALALVSDAWLRALEALDAAGDDPSAASPSLEEELFAQIAAILRKLKPYRKYLPAALETTLSPAVIEKGNGQASLRCTHVEMVGQIVSRHGQLELLSPLALQLYWTLFAGVLTFWASDSSPRQEDTLALLDQSLAMFVAWLTEASGSRLPGRDSPAALSSAPGLARLAGPTSANQG
jgi:AcrR family transcriptional regulator